MAKPDLKVYQPTERPKVKTVRDYIKFVINGVAVESPLGEYETQVALHAARTAIGCVVGRNTTPRDRVQAELVRVRGEA